MFRAALPLALIALLSSCVGPPKDRRPVAVAVPVSPELRQCLGGLDRLNARYSLVSGNNVGGGCSTLSSIKLTVAGVPITNVTAIQCPLAEALTQWVQGPVQIAARRHLGSKVVRIDSFGAYSCRNVIGRASAAGKRSEHATANAVDISAFVLSDGRRVSVLGGWNGKPEERDFLRAVRAEACTRFQTVLSPDFNAAHADHLHFDMGRGPFCR
ncbi:MAG: extensin family protein [Sphingomonadaceae bacterium]